MAQVQKPVFVQWLEGQVHFKLALVGLLDTSLKPINQDFFWENWTEADLYLCTDSTKLLSKCQ